MDRKSPNWNLVLYNLDYVWIACLVSPESMGGKWCVKAKLFSDNSWTNIQAGSWIKRLLCLEIIIFHKKKKMNILQEATGASFTPLFQSSLFLSLESHIGCFSLGITMCHLLKEQFFIHFDMLHQILKLDSKTIPGEVKVSSFNSLS